MYEPHAKQRIARMLAQDKEDMNEESRAAALLAFERVAAEFFEREGETAFTVKRGKRGYEVSLSFRASRVKNFTALK